MRKIVVAIFVSILVATTIETTIGTKTWLRAKPASGNSRIA
jgi:hypothetical protein